MPFCVCFRESAYAYLSCFHLLQHVFPLLCAFSKAVEVLDVYSEVIPWGIVSTLSPNGSFPSMGMIDGWIPLCFFVFVCSWGLGNCSPAVLNSAFHSAMFQARPAFLFVS